MITPVIICGGVGTRLWPVSRNADPKQFLKIDGNFSLFQNTLLRVNDSKIFGDPIVICNEAFKFRIAADLEEISVKSPVIIVEPFQKNTCPAIALAAHYIQKHLKKEDQQLLILPSDHAIKDDNAFIEHVKIAASYDSLNDLSMLFTFGVVPNSPATGYGYIKKGEDISKGINKVDRFTEKPERQLAEEFISTEDYLWNSGIFLFNASLYLRELKTYESDIFKLTEISIDKSEKNFNFISIDEDSFNQCTNISIDHAILEKSSNIAVVPMNINWNDLGTWKGIYDYSDKDSDGNVTLTDHIEVSEDNNASQLKEDSQNFLLDKSRDCMVYADKGMHVSMHGMDNVIVVATKDAVLVIDLNKSENVKSIHSKLCSSGSSLVKSSALHYRPWGSYEDLMVSDRYRVKKIKINPKGKISLQYHNKRAEHWVIIKGKAKVTKGEENLWLNQDESIYIPIGIIHRLENTSDSCLELIEVQVGSEVVEEDIVRLNDKYNRA